MKVLITAIKLALEPIAAALLVVGLICFVLFGAVWLYAHAPWAAYLFFAAVIFVACVVGMWPRAKQIVRDSK